MAQKGQKFKMVLTRRDFQKILRSHNEQKCIRKISVGNHHQKNSTCDLFLTCSYQLLRIRRTN